MNQNDHLMTAAMLEMILEALADEETDLTVAELDNAFGGQLASLVRRAREHHKTLAQ